MDLELTASGVLEPICEAYARNDEAGYTRLEPEARAIGGRLAQQGGLSEMRRLFASVEGRPGSRALEMLWNGIGDWSG